MRNILMAISVFDNTFFSWQFFQMSKYTLCTQDMTISMELNLAYKLGMGIFVYKYTPKFIFVNSYFATA